MTSTQKQLQLLETLREQNPYPQQFSSLIGDDSQITSRRADQLADWCLGEAPHPDGPTPHVNDDDSHSIPPLVTNHESSDAASEREVERQFEAMGRRSPVESETRQLSDLGSREDEIVEAMLRDLGR